MQQNRRGKRIPRINPVLLPLEDSVTVTASLISVSLVVDVVNEVGLGVTGLLEGLGVVDDVDAGTFVGLGVGAPVRVLGMGKIVAQSYRGTPLSFS